MWRRREDVRLIGKNDVDIIKNILTTFLDIDNLIMINKFLELEASQQKKLVFSVLGGLGISSLFTFGFVDSEPEGLSKLEVVEKQREIAQANSEVNAKLFQKEHKQFYGAYISTDVDFSINSKCVTGDGWSKVELVDGNKGNVVAELMCSTISKSLGCELVSEFDERSYAIQENTCNLELPVPLSKLTIY